MTNANLAGAARVTVTWTRGQTAIDDGLLSDLRNGIDAARAAGTDVYLDAYPADSSQTPATTADQTRFATWLAGVVKGIPGLKHVIVGNEPNLNLFWAPQFGAAGQDAAAVGYERLLARAYDAVKQVAPQVEIVGGTLAHSGTNRRGTGRDTHSPARFILDMGTAYRASHRTKPIMDAFSYHPYMERSDLPPTFRHNPLSNTMTIADYGKLISSLERAFGGTRQKGETLPLVYDEFGVESKIPAAYASLYTGTEPPTTHPVSEATQARYYADGFHLAACQPTVRTIMVFRLIDQPALVDWQSGVYYADRKTPKSSRAAVAAAATRYRAKTVAGCAALLAPRPLVDWKRRVLTCDADCAYTADVPARRLVEARADGPRNRNRRGSHAPRRRKAEARPLPHRAEGGRHRLQGERLHDGQPGLRLEPALDHDRTERLDVAELPVDAAHRRVRRVRERDELPVTVLRRPRDLGLLQLRRDPTATVAAEHGGQPVLQAVRRGVEVLERRVSDDTAVVEGDESRRVPLDQLTPARKRECDHRYGRRNVGNALDLDLVDVGQVLVGEQNDALGDGAVALLHLPKKLDLLPCLSEAPRSSPRPRASVVAVDPPDHPGPAVPPRLAHGSFEERGSDSPPARLGLHAHHRELPVRKARVGHVDVAAVRKQGSPSGAPHVGERDRVGRIDRVEDLDAPLEVGVRLGRAEGDHPDRFNFPWRLAYCSPRRNTHSPSGIATTPIRSKGQMSPQTAAGVAPSRIAALIPRSA